SLPTLVDSLRAFSRDWAFNAGFWNATLAASHRAGFEGRGVADAVSLGLTAAVIAYLAWRPLPGVAGLATDVGWVLGLYVVLSPTVMPWYLLWALPLLAFGAGRSGLSWNALAWPAVTAASLVSYGVYFDGAERAAWLAWEHAMIAAVLIPAFWSRIRASRQLKTCGAP
ncbi:MAG: hypothetical protein AAFY88_18770, partial [Acidobacteriota bacterium]